MSFHARPCCPSLFNGPHAANCPRLTAGAKREATDRELLQRAAEALRTISEWKPETFPRVPDRQNPGETVSYGYAYGSNGERDFMRNVASDTLSAIEARLKEKP